MRVGVDTGGTFTDIVVLEPGTVRVAKVLSTPANPAEAVLRGLRQLVPAGTPMVLTYGTTVATNALLERRGARVLLFTTAGFEDVIAIGRQARPDLYALEPELPPPLVQPRDRVGVSERMAFDGSVLSSLQPRALDAAIARARRTRPEAIAVCFLHSYINPTHERRLARALRRAGFCCCASHEINAQPREYERFSTAVINAYVTPKMSRHLGDLSSRLRGSTFRVMQSNGGAISGRVAAREAARTILSGPAAGVVGAVSMARSAGLRKIITFDMGGTSTDVCLVDGEPSRRRDCEIGGLPITLPAVDVHTVGAGGGSIAFCDAGGALKVGPESAGADPGPACYGKGVRPTVTDANLVLGRLGTGVLAGGFRLDRGRADRAVSVLGRALRLGRDETAAGIVRVANAAMERAIRTVSIERGHDPRGYVLVAFGGAAGLHACDLAAALGIPRVFVPREAGVLSAWGAARSDVVRDYVRTIRALAPSLIDLRRVVSALAAVARRDMAAECVTATRVRLQAFAEARYAGQSYEIEVPVVRSYADRFHAAHRRLYGYADHDRAVEVVHVGLRAIGVQGSWRLPAVDRETAPAQTTRLRAGRRWVEARLVARRSMAAKVTLPGPVVITELSSTTYVPPGWRAQVDRAGHLHLRHAR